MSDRLRFSGGSATKESEPKTSEFEIVFQATAVDVSGIDPNAILMAQPKLLPFQIFVATNKNYVELNYLAAAITSLLESNGEFGFNYSGGGGNFDDVLSRNFGSTAPDVEKLDIRIEHSADKGTGKKQSGDKETGKITVKVEVTSKGSSDASQIAVSNLAAALKERILTPAAILNQLKTYARPAEAKNISAPQPAAR